MLHFTDYIDIKWLQTKRFFLNRLFPYNHVPDAVFEAVVGRPGKDVVAAAQLLDVSQALELGRVDDGDTQRVELDMSVHAVVEHLGARQ